MSSIKSLISISILLITLISCNKNFGIEIRKSTKLKDTTSENTKGEFFEYKTNNSRLHFRVNKNEESICSVTVDLDLFYDKWKNDSTWLVNNLSFYNSKLAGFYLIHSPPSIRYFEQNGNLNYILKFDFLIAEENSLVNGDYIKLDTGIEYRYTKKSLNNWINRSAENGLDTLTLKGIGNNIEKGKYVSFQKEFLFENNHNGLLIKEINTFTKDDLKNLKEIFGSGSYLIEEFSDLPTQILNNE